MLFISKSLQCLRWAIQCCCSSRRILLYSDLPTEVAVNVTYHYTGHHHCGLVHVNKIKNQIDRVFMKKIKSGLIIRCHVVNTFSKVC